MAIAVLEPVAEPIVIDGLTWQDFKAVEQLLDRPGIRLSFLAGALEIRKMPGRQHETLKKRIAALIEIYLEIKGFDFTPTGSVTLASEGALVNRYQSILKSALLPDLDMDLFQQCINQSNHAAALREFRQAVTH